MSPSSVKSWTKLVAGIGQVTVAGEERTDLEFVVDGQARKCASRILRGYQDTISFVSLAAKVSSGRDAGLEDSMAQQRTHGHECPD